MAERPLRLAGLDLASACDDELAGASVEDAAGTGVGGVSVPSGTSVNESLALVTEDAGAGCEPSLMESLTTSSMS